MPKRKQMPIVKMEAGYKVLKRNKKGIITKVDLTHTSIDRKNAEMFWEAVEKESHRLMAAQIKYDIIEELIQAVNKATATADKRCAWEQPVIDPLLFVKALEDMKKSLRKD